MKRKDELCSISVACELDYCFIIKDVKNIEIIFVLLLYTRNSKHHSSLTTNVNLVLEQK